MTEPTQTFFIPAHYAQVNEGAMLGMDIVDESGAPLFHKEQLRSLRAAELGDLHSIVQDLERAIALCERLDDDSLDDELTASAVWEAAVMAYARCFVDGQSSRGKGKRRKIPNDVLRKRPPNLIDQHKKVMEDYRGKHVGHRAGATEEVVVEALREAPGGPVTALQVWGARMMRPDDHLDLRALATDLLSRLRPLFIQERDALLRTIQAG